MHGLRMRDRPELHHTKESIELRGFLNSLDLLDASVWVAYHTHAVVDQKVKVNFARIDTFVFANFPVGFGRDLFSRAAGFPRLQYRRRNLERDAAIRHEGALGLL